MINFIKMDLFRYFKSIGFWVCLGIFTFLCISDAVATKKMINQTYEEYVKDNYDMTVEEFENVNQEADVEIGISSQTDELAKQVTKNKRITYESCISLYFAGNFVQVFMCILMSIFVCKEYKSGFIKNTINIPRHRWYNNISKFIIAIITFMIFILDILISNKIVVKDIYIGNYATLFKYLGVQFLLILAFMALIIFICNLFKSTAVSITVSILLTTGMILVVLYGVSYVIPVKVETLMKFFISTVNGGITLDITGQALIEAIALGVTALTGYGFLGALIFNKQDV